MAPLLSFSHIGGQYGGLRALLIGHRAYVIETGRVVQERDCSLSVDLSTMFTPERVSKPAE